MTLFKKSGQGSGVEVLGLGLQHIFQGDTTEPTTGKDTGSKFPQLVCPEPFFMEENTVERMTCGTSV